MKNQKKLFEKEMKRIMLHIITCGDIPPLDDFGMECLHHCCQSGYLTGVHTARMASGHIVADRHTPKVQKAGLDFCYPKTTFESKINVVLVITTIVSTLIAIIQLLSD